MYHSCMFCRKSLGKNELIESFPVGKRLAFDENKGRLWVVCRRCERWNLTPLEERWEAVEECERIFRATRVRASTENIGIARHAEGTELVRIGEPLRPEFASWRYGDQFGRRRKRRITYGVAGAVVVGGVMVGGAVTGVLSFALMGQGGTLYQLWMNSGKSVKVRTPDGKIVKIGANHLPSTRLRLADGGELTVEVKKGLKKYRYDGEAAREVAALVVPKLNATGGKQDVVQDAVSRIERAGHPDAFLDEVATLDSYRVKGKPGYIQQMPKATRLALEMALHEEGERRALEGELWLLERAWREAEEIAAISDSLLLPESAKRVRRA